MNPALTQLMRRFQVSEADVAWTVSAFFITAAIAPIVAGRLGDMFGKKRVLITQLLIFTMGALVSAAGPTVWAVVAGRVVMGCGAGIFPLSYGIIRDEFPVTRITSAIGVMAVSVGVGIAIGFPFGGLLIEHLGVPAIFLTTATMAGLDALAVLALVPESRQRRPSRIDLVGVFLLCSGLITLLAAISRGLLGLAGPPDPRPGVHRAGGGGGPRRLRAALPAATGEPPHAGQP
jgi:MFS family permease